MVSLQLKDAKVELEVEHGKSYLTVNGYRLTISNASAHQLIFGGEVIPKPTLAKTTAPSAPSPPKQTPKKRGCQSPASREKLSKSLRKWHAKRRKEEEASLKGMKSPNKKHLNGKSHLNGLHVN
jgi:hypothetical protein